jgi:ABC-type multidrug transport system fused ATPase/permease subunit
VDLHRPLIDNPLTIIIGIAGLLVLLGPSALIGLSVIVISSPISGLVMKWTYKIFKKTKILRDKRIQYTNEALQGIRIIKYMSWESQFLKKIRMARESELASRIYGLLGWVALWMVGWGSSILVVFTSLFTYTIIFEHTLDAATAFTCISLLGTVTWVLNDISQVVSEVMNIRLSISRIQKFLDEEEIDNSRFLKNEDTKLNTSTKLALSNASYQYYMSEKNTEKTLNEQSNLLDNPEYNRQPLFQLKNISVEFPIGKLSCIVGPTGSGKTSLILSILGGNLYLTNNDIRNEKNRWGNFGAKCECL